MNNFDLEGRKADFTEEVSIPIHSKNEEGVVAGDFIN